SESSRAYFDATNLHTIAPSRIHPMRRIPALIGIAAVFGALYWIWQAPERGDGEGGLHTPAAVEESILTNGQSGESDPTPPAEGTAPSRRTPRDPRLAGYNDFSRPATPATPEEI